MAGASEPAGFVGSTTVAPGWARPGEDFYRLRRLRILAGTTPAQLLALIRGSVSLPAPPAAYPPAG